MGAFRATLRSQNVGRLVLVGQHTDCCVRRTSYDAFVRGYELVICPEATTVFALGSEEPIEIRQNRALNYLQTYYGATQASRPSVRSGNQSEPHQEIRRATSTYLLAYCLPPDRFLGRSIPHVTP